MATFEFEPIGFVRSSVRYTQEAPRQGVLTAQSGVIQLEKQRNFEAAFADLAASRMLEAFSTVNKSFFISGRIGVGATEL